MTRKGVLTVEAIEVDNLELRVLLHEENHHMRCSKQIEYLALRMPSPSEKQDVGTSKYSYY